MLCWLDIETTGLDRKNDRILEVGVIVTDDDLQEVLRHAIVCRWLGDRASLHPVVRQMHERSGLLDACEKSQDTLMTAEIDLVQLLTEAGCVGVPLCGSSIHFDRGFLAEQVQGLHKIFSYRSVDVSTLTELAKRWFPEVYEGRPGADEKDKPHRALEDLDFSIELLRYYRKTILYTKSLAPYEESGWGDNRDPSEVCNKMISSLKSHQIRCNRSKHDGPCI